MCETLHAPHVTLWSPVQGARATCLSCGPRGQRASRSGGAARPIRLRQRPAQRRGPVGTPAVARPGAGDDDAAGVSADGEAGGGGGSESRHGVGGGGGGGGALASLQVEGMQLKLLQIKRDVVAVVDSMSTGAKCSTGFSLG